MFKREDFLEVMTWLEDPNTILDGQETLWELSNMSNVNLDQETWELVSKALQSILLHKAEEKSQAFVLTKRAKTIFGTWYEVNKWYTATSGMGLSDRTRAVMNPKQATKDSDVIYELRKWEDELRDLKALGASELGFDYMLTAIRQIATPVILQQMDMADAKVEPGSHEQK